MIKPNPFTPKSGLEPKVFVNRANEISFFLKRIKESSVGTLNHYIINGEWGSGKTSLLRYFKLLAQEERYTACYFPAKEFAEDTSDIEISAHIVQSIIRNLPYKLSKKSSKFYKLVRGIGVQVLGSGFNISFDIDKKRHVDSQIFLMDSILSIWSDIKNQTDLLVILVDDVQNYSRVQRIFTALKNVLSDERIIKQAKVLFILSSTIEGWSSFMKINHPIGRFFVPRIELDNFTMSDTLFLIDSILKDTNVYFTRSVKEKIYRYSNGHLFQIHTIAGALYNNQRKGKVTDKEWERGFYESLVYLGNTVYNGIIQNLSDTEIELIKNIKQFRNVKISDFEPKFDSCPVGV